MFSNQTFYWNSTYAPAKVATNLICSKRRRGISTSIALIAIVGAMLIGLEGGWVLTNFFYGNGPSVVTVYQTQTQDLYVPGSGNTPNSSLSIVPYVVRVSIISFSFQPYRIVLVIGVNNTVTWTNEDDTAHTVTSSTGSFYSGPLNPGASWTYTFEENGTYNYECSIHPEMQGVVIVESG